MPAPVANAEAAAHAPARHESGIMKAVVELTRATKRYGRIAALQDVSLALNPGETVAVIGHNGAGGQLYGRYPDQTIQQQPHLAGYWQSGGG